MGMTAAASSGTTQLETLRGLVRTATQRLLGDTILVTDDQWRAPSRLPEWTRGHVATHIARHADAIGRLAQWARTGERQNMYASPEHRVSEIEAGAGRSGAWDAVVEMRGGLQLPARLLPLPRLLEVVIHHVDLNIGYEITDIDTQTAEWLLEWCAFRLQNRDDFPTLQLTSDSGLTLTLGSVGEPLAVTGSSANLLGWLMSRTDTSAVTGGSGLRLPAF
jgi:maleylpyruvate isomerase